MSLVNYIAKHCLTFGDFTLSSGQKTSYYVDMRCILQNPKMMSQLSQEISNKVKGMGNIVSSVPYGTVPISCLVSKNMNLPLIMPRKKAKEYGSKKSIEGVFKEGDKVILIEDVVTTGNSLLETVEMIKNNGLQIGVVIVILDRQNGGIDLIKNSGLNVVTMFTIKELLFELYKDETYLNKHLIRKTLSEMGDEYTHNIKNRLDDIVLNCPNNKVKQLAEIMIQKKSNLCISIDKKFGFEVLKIAEKVGPYAAIIKVHYDTWDESNYTMDVDNNRDHMWSLSNLGKKYNFMVMDDRKISDIGKTCIKKIQNCNANLMTIHGFSVTPEIAQLDCDVGLVVIDSMSHDTGKKILNSDYSGKCRQHIKELIDANKFPNLVAFVSQNGIPIFGDIGFNQIYYVMTPGVRLIEGKEQDQNYMSLEEAKARNADIIIVGSDICDSDDPAAMAKLYKEKYWNLSFKQL